MEAIEAAGRAYLASLSCPISAKCAQFSTALKMCTEAQFSVALSRAILYSTVLPSCTALPHSTEQKGQRVKNCAKNQTAAVERKAIFTKKGRCKF